MEVMKLFKVKDSVCGLINITDVNTAVTEIVRLKGAHSGFIFSIEKVYTERPAIDWQTLTKRYACTHYHNASVDPLYKTYQRYNKRGDQEYQLWLSVLLSPRARILINIYPKLHIIEIL